MSSFDWPTIRALYQSGRTAYQLAKLPGYPSKQGIAKRARKEGWSVGNSEGNPGDNQVAVAEPSLPATYNGDPRRGQVLAQLKGGATYKLAASSAGIEDRTLREWRETDPAFADACRTAKAAHKLKLLRHIDSAAERDWKAAAWRIERDEDTREDFRPSRQQGHGFPFTINFGGFNRGGLHLPTLPTIDVESEPAALPEPEGESGQ